LKAFKILIRELRRYCMARYEDDYEDESQEQACFIATAVYGTPLLAEVEVLRRFRDEFLKPNPAGRVLVAIYYRLSPPLARFISRHRRFRAAVRGCLVNPAVSLARAIRSRRTG
jgi:hypothetical protein